MRRSAHERSGPRPASPPRRWWVAAATPRIRRASGLLFVLLASLSAACSGSDGGGDAREAPDTTVAQSTTAPTVAAADEPGTSAPTSTIATGTSDAQLDADRATLSNAAASGDFCTAYGAYDLLASRTDDPESPEAVAIFRVGFEATAGIDPLVPVEIEDSWSTFVFGAGLIDQAVAETGRLPDDPELDAALERLGYYEAGDDVTRWYLEYCG